MQAGIHPKYRPVIFRDASDNASFLIGSTVEAREKGIWEEERIMDSQGRAEKSGKRFGGEARGSTVRESRAKPPIGPAAGPESE